jgi:hypothetical protein
MSTDTLMDMEMDADTDIDTDMIRYVDMAMYM